MKTIKIQAIDTLFFRAGKPFSMGEETSIETKLIPSPTVFWGAIFTRLLVDNKLQTHETDKLKIGRVFLCDEKNHRFLLPAPADLFIDKDKNIYTEKYQEVKELFVSSNISATYIVTPDTEKDVKRIENSFIEIYSFAPYISKFNNDITIFNLTEILVLENKIGIKRDNSTNITETGILYRIPMLRFKDNWSYLVEYEIEGEKQLENNGILKLGGEGKTAQFSNYEKPLLEISKECVVEKEEFFKIYASSPLILKSYDFISWLKLFKETLNSWELVSISNSTPISVGGWDLEKRKPKPMKKAMPAGSVFVFKNLDKPLNTKEIRKSFELILNQTETKFGFNQFEIFNLK